MSWVSQGMEQGVIVTVMGGGGRRINSENFEK